MKKENILEKYVDAKARIKYLEQSIHKTEDKIQRLREKDYGCVSDVVTCGKKRRKPLGTVKVTGYNINEDRKLRSLLSSKKALLKKQQEDLLELTNQVEEFIADIEDIEIQTIFSLYYIEGYTWMKVSTAMNELYENKIYTDSACRKKHERFLRKKI